MTSTEKRYFHHTEELLRAHPEFLDDEAASLDARLDIVATAVPELAAEASKKAISEWGRPAADITHLVFSTYSACQAPTADLRLATLLGLRPTVSRTMLSLHGCYGGGRALSLAKELAENNLNPIKIARNSPGISNLMFADDNLIFFKAVPEQATTIKKVLDTFQKCTGQLLSSNKCSPLFSESCPPENRDAIKNILGVVSASFESKYLGLPTPEGRMKEEQFQPIMDRFGKRCSDWSEKFMSYAAKEVHVKSVVHALPTFTMSVFMLSKQ